MDEFRIKNIAAARLADGGIAVSWVWPAGYQCVRIVFLHLLGDRDIARLSPAELSEVSDLCFMDEFRIAGGRYICPSGKNSAGLLKFRVYCCESPEKTDLDGFSDIVRITGTVLNIRYTSTEKKSGKMYKKVTLHTEADVSVPAGTLVYKSSLSGAVYPVSRIIPAGPSETGPVILGEHDSLTLALAPGHEDEYKLISG